MNLETLKKLTPFERKKNIEEILAKRGEKINWNLVKEYRNSTEKYRELNPIIVDKKTGMIVDGYHRFLAFPNWPSVEKEIEDPDLASFLLNRRRRQSKEEKIATVNYLAKKLREKGNTKESLTKEISKILGWSERTVRRYLDSSFKMVSKGRNLRTIGHKNFNCPLCRSKISEEEFNNIKLLYDHILKKLEEERKEKKYYECPACFNPFKSAEENPLCPNCGLPINK